MHHFFCIFREKIGNRSHNDNGFSLIEVLIAISLFSIGFMALTATIWSASSTTRTTSYADMTMMEGQDMVEVLSVIPIDHDTLDQGSHVMEKNGGLLRVEWEVLDPVDFDNIGTDDFKTIAISVFNQEQDRLMMKSYYRRRSY